MNARLRSTLAVIVPLLPLFFGVLWLVERVQFWRCPSGTFLAGAEHLLLQNFALLFFAFASDFLLLYAAAQSLVLFDLLGGEATFGNARTRRRIVLVAAAAFLVMGPLGLTMASSSFCLSPTQIWVRPWPWQAVRKFGWSDVDLVEAKCTHAKSWSATLRLYFRSGEAIEIPHTQIADGFPGIRRAIRGLPVAVDTRGIDPNCDVPEKDLLLQLQ